MTPVFTEKLDGLDGTVRLLENFDVGSIADGLADGRGRYSIAVGSGGSAIAARFFARCRESLGLGPDERRDADGRRARHPRRLWQPTSGCSAPVPRTQMSSAAAIAALQRRCRPAAHGHPGTFGCSRGRRRKRRRPRSLRARCHQSRRLSRHPLDDRDDRRPAARLGRRRPRRTRPHQTGPREC